MKLSRNKISKLLQDIYQTHVFTRIQCTLSDAHLNKDDNIHKRKV